MADQVTINWRSADLSDRERAICDAAMTLAMEPGKFGESQRKSLRGVGLSEDDIWDLGAITAFFALSNRMAHVTDMKPNAEFYTMGR
jgi:4-carboxymuconolactone decarboxylase